MEKRFKTNGSGRDTGENVQGYLQMLQSDPGKGLHREASEWKRKTIIQYLNSKGWNLKELLSHHFLQSSLYVKHRSQDLRI